MVEQQTVQASSQDMPMRRIGFPFLLPQHSIHVWAPTTSLNHPLRMHPTPQAPHLAALHPSSIPPPPPTNHTHLEVLGVLLLVVRPLVVQVGGGVGQVAQEAHRAGQRLLGGALLAAGRGWVGSGVGWVGNERGMGVARCGRSCGTVTRQAGFIAEAAGCGASHPDLGASRGVFPSSPSQGAMAPPPAPAQKRRRAWGVLAGGSSAWLRDTSMPNSVSLASRNSCRSGLALRAGCAACGGMVGGW